MSARAEIDKGWTHGSIGLAVVWDLAEIDLGQPFLDLGGVCWWENIQRWVVGGRDGGDSWEGWCARDPGGRRAASVRCIERDGGVCWSARGESGKVTVRSAAAEQKMEPDVRDSEAGHGRQRGLGDVWVDRQ